MNKRSIDHINLTHHDSERRDIIIANVSGTDTEIQMTPAEAAVLAGRLLEIVVSYGFELTAKRPRQ